MEALLSKKTIGKGLPHKWCMEVCKGAHYFPQALVFIDKRTIMATNTIQTMYDKPRVSLFSYLSSNAHSE